MNEQQKWIVDALNWLRQNGTINNNQYESFLSHYQKSNNNFELVQQELTRMYHNDQNFIIQKYNEINEPEIEIIDVETVISNNDEINRLIQTKEQLINTPPTNSIYTQQLDDYEDIEKLNSIELQETKGIQKTIGKHPLYKKAGFMNMLFFIFLTGISSGIILMIILNLLVK